MTEIQAFTDIERKALITPVVQDYMSNIEYLQVGAGNQMVKADNAGLSVGGKTWALSPFRVGMDGIMHAYGADISGDLNVGGLGNGDGVLTIRDAAGNIIIQGDNTGHTYYDLLGNLSIRINDEGFKFYEGALVRIFIGDN